MCFEIYCYEIIIFICLKYYFAGVEFCDVKFSYASRPDAVVLQVSEVAPATNVVPTYHMSQDPPSQYIPEIVASTKSSVCMQQELI